MEVLTNVCDASEEGCLCVYAVRNIAVRCAILMNNLAG